MFEAHRRRPETSEVYIDEEPGNASGGVGHLPVIPEEEETAEEEFGRADGNGEVSLNRPERATKARNSPVAAVTATRGDISQFRGIPNSRPKGDGEQGTVFLRCGGPGQFRRQCPDPIGKFCLARKRAPVPGSRDSKKGNPTGKEGAPTFSEPMTQRPHWNTWANNRFHMLKDPTLTLDSRNLPPRRSTLITPSLIRTHGRRTTTHKIRLPKHGWPSSHGLVMAQLHLLTRKHQWESGTVKLSRRMHLLGNRAPTKLPPILLDFGAPGAVVGKMRLNQWARGPDMALSSSPRSFRFGDGLEGTSLGACVLLISIPPRHTD